MRRTRIIVKGRYGATEKIKVQVVRVEFTGEGALDFIETELFRGEESAIDEHLDIRNLTQEEFDKFEQTTIKYFRRKYSTENDFFQYMIC